MDSSTNQLALLQRRVLRERNARESAESILEVKSREIFMANKRLSELAARLKKQRDKTFAIVENASEGIVTLDLSGLVESFNRAATEIFGIDGEEACGRPVSSFFEQKHRDEIRSLIHQDSPVEQEGISEFTARNSKGDLLAIEMTLSRTRGEDCKLIAIIRDRTRAKVLESQLAEGQKLESVGQLAAGIAHEINTPIQYVGDNAQFLKDAFEDLSQLLTMYSDLMGACASEPQLQPIIDQIKTTQSEADLDFLLKEVPAAIEQTMTGTQRVAKIVRAMKEFSHPGTETKVAVDINHSLESTLTVCRNEWKYIAEVEYDLDPSLPKVECLPGDLNQAFLNLIINAAHAIDQRLASANEGEFHGVIRISTKSTEQYVEVRIGDNGIGIEEDVLPKVFAPFFTTKPIGKGTGQGLAITQNVIVNKHQGSIVIESTPGEGTTFILRLPRNSKNTRSNA